MRQNPESLSEEERLPDPEYDETVAITDALATVLTAEERHAARELTHDVWCIATRYCALWVEPLLV